MTPEEQAQSLLDRGYVEVQQAAGFSVGDRVRHIGQQYYDARVYGTGNVERIFAKPSLLRYPDVELIVKRDKPLWGPTDTHGYWANYHTQGVNA